MDHRIGTEDNTGRKEDNTGRKLELPLQYLKDITDNFSSDREIGRGGFGVVYKVYFLTLSYNESLSFCQMIR